jgi:hypothetical protein
MSIRLVLLCTVFWLPPAFADIWLCVGANNRQSIQDKPCGQGLRTKSHVVDAPRRSAVSGSRGGAEPKAAGKTPIAVGLDRNRGVICQLLDAEKADAEAQIAGRMTPPLGENPQDNLGKIEKQRTRVGCDAG